jgi:hypothetical protein
MLPLVALVPQWRQNYPNVWSGRASQRFSSSCRLCGLASMYPASVWSVCSGPPWISAHLRSHYRPSLKWAIWGTSVRKRREDRSSISSHPLADLGGKQNVVLRHRLLLIGPVPLFVPGGRSFVPACGPPGRRAEGPSSLAVALTSPLARRFQARLDGTEHGATLKQVGAPSCLSWCTRSCAPC